jgi:hypothetical protein
VNYTHLKKNVSFIYSAGELGKSDRIGHEMSATLQRAKDVKGLVLFARSYLFYEEDRAKKPNPVS